jgi:predicted O-linked N-acetylglucosamine transferase (SPINDLY family)
VDYFLTDAVATPAEYAKTLFTEKLMFLSTSYLVNSHASWQKHLLKQNCPIDRETFLKSLQPFRNLVYGNSPDTLQKHPDRAYFGSFHGPIKIDPDVFHIWMNILRRMPNSEVVMSKPKANLNAKKAADILHEVSSELKEIAVYSHHRYYNNNRTENRLHQCAYHGIDVGRVSHISTLEWHEHLHMKSGFTLYLDTLIKNGHSTSVDAMFASIPMVALGDVMHSTGRSTQSIAHYAQSSYGIVNTLKEYEDMVIRLTKSKQGTVN